MKLLSTTKVSPPDGLNTWVDVPRLNVAVPPLNRESAALDVAEPCIDMVPVTELGTTMIPFALKYSELLGLLMTLDKLVVVANVTADETGSVAEVVAVKLAETPPMLMVALVSVNAVEAVVN